MCRSIASSSLVCGPRRALRMPCVASRVRARTALDVMRIALNGSRLARERLRRRLTHSSDEQRRRRSMLFIESECVSYVFAKVLTHLLISLDGTASKDVRNNNSVLLDEQHGLSASSLVDGQKTRIVGYAATGKMTSAAE